MMENMSWQLKWVYGVFREGDEEVVVKNKTVIKPSKKIKIFLNCKSGCFADVAFE